MNEIQTGRTGGRRYRHALVAGLGDSGEGAARLLLSEGSQVTVVDAHETAALRSRAHVLERLGAVVFLGWDRIPANGFDVCIVSPGVPVASPMLQELRARGVALLSELELGWSRSSGPILAITGTNGKSTAVKWCWEALWRVDRQARIAGNYGWPLSGAVGDSAEADPWILEVSSFQLETVHRFRAEVAMLLNLHPNHLDRHGDMESYLAAKARLFANAGPGDTCIVPYEWLGRMQELSGGEGEWVTFGTNAQADYVYRDGMVLRDGAPLASLEGTLYGNDTMGPTAAAVVAGLAAFGAPPGMAEDAARRLQPLPHRMQLVADVEGVRFVNDSKATNLAAMAAGVKLSEGRVRLIAGGQAKEKDFETVKEVLAERVDSIYLVGASAEEMASAWSDVVSCVPCGALPEAVKRAWDDAQAGETILLSPGCASFDQFRDFQERGECFASLVKNLAEEDAKCKTRCPGV